MKMRFRTDSWHIADLKSGGKTFEQHWEGTSVLDDLEQKKEFDETPKAEPGDVWRITWGGDYEGPRRLAGYAICCIGCGKVHAWTTATNCEPKTEHSWTDNKGEVHTYKVCQHSGNSSCWQWTGSAEEGTLTGAPSLQVIPLPDQPCNWHGYIQNGDIHV